MDTYTLNQLVSSKGKEKGFPNTWEANLFSRDFNKFQILEYASCSSSLDVAWSLVAASKLHPGDSLLCLEQISGRGRMRRGWVSPRGNIYAALYLPGPQNQEAHRLLSIIVGYCLVRALRDKGLGVSLKWPNDLILSSKKIGGILLEEKQGTLICGVGLNLKTPPESKGLRSSRLTDAGTLHEAWPDSQPLQAWAELVSAFAHWYNKILYNFSLFDFIQEIGAYVWLMGQKVRVQTGNESKQGYLQGLDTHGGIILDCAGRQEHIHSGQIVECSSISGNSENKA